MPFHLAHGISRHHASRAVLALALALPTAFTLASPSTAAAEPPTPHEATQSAKGTGADEAPGKTEARKAKPAPGYALTIAIDNGHTTASQGDRLTYTIQVTNTGPQDSPDLTISQTLVPGLKLLSTTPPAKNTQDRITWTRTLPAGEKAEFKTTAEVGDLPANLQRLAIVACATKKNTNHPIVCATHTARLPTPTTHLQSHVPPASPSPWYWLAGASALLLAGAAFLRRRLSRHR
ncbi:DUF11 domain-containing protein [Acrocarpospora catenulata]|uniref:DUF11 domain-containing protein n=1 Tax=Acrocarpospora catenulata TaxID=2836182 RepID=UPI001BD9DD59|nr:DUF11 domain-containing protein [Acrocarpospora catenulata]